MCGVCLVSRGEFLLYGLCCGCSGEGVYGGAEGTSLGGAGVGWDGVGVALFVGPSGVCGAVVPSVEERLEGGGIVWQLVCVCGGVGEL